MKIGEYYRAMHPAFFPSPKPKLYKFAGLWHCYSESAKVRITAPTWQEAYKVYKECES